MYEIQFRKAQNQQLKKHKYMKVQNSLIYLAFLEMKEFKLSFYCACCTINDHFYFKHKNFSS